MKEKLGFLYPEGFLAASINCGIKASKKDLTLLCCPKGASIAATFTKNNCCAAPVTVCREHLKGGRCRALIINSGNANAATGDRGLADARECAARVAEVLGCPEEEVMVSSTGCIGLFLPKEKIIAAVPEIAGKLADTPEADEDAATGILTTDLVMKRSRRDVALSTGNVKVGGMCKGSGMIMPNMATMLAYITTDARVDSPRLQEIFGRAVQRSFNQVSVDGDTSTNDSAFCLASGAANAAPATEQDWALLETAITEVCQDLAKKIAMDGEGASKFVELVVEGCASDQDAKQIAITIANSPLVKTSICGGDPNWGRILAAAGRAGIPYDQYTADLFIGDLCAARGGMNAGTPREELAKVYAQKEIRIRLVLKEGAGTATVWTCDLTHGYVDINVAYT